MQQPQFDALANHWSGVKLITLWAVSWRQPGDIYRWTRVSNLAITAPLINSLSESLPGAQGFRDSDGLMMLVSCYSAALALYTLWFDTLQKDHNNCGSPLNMTTHTKRSLSAACPLKVFCLRWLGYWLSSKWKRQLILGEGWLWSSPENCLPARAHGVLRSASLMLLRQNYWHISRVQDFCKKETFHNILSNRQQKKAHSASAVLHIATSSWFVSWTNLMYTSRYLKGPTAREATPSRYVILFHLTAWKRSPAFLGVFSPVQYFFIFLNRAPFFAKPNEN